MTPRWRPNIGSRPERTHEEFAALDAACAPDSAYRIERVYVRLRNGTTPPDPWPVDTGRNPNTRWTLKGDSHDIIEWMEA